MILLQKQKLVIVTPPHTGSGALHKTLCTPEIGGIWVNGINPDGGIVTTTGPYTMDGYMMGLRSLR
jgi:hypothetical protein